MNSAGTLSVPSGRTRLHLLSRGFLYRALLVVFVVALTHEFEWRWLRFLTSEAILRISPLLGMSSGRISFDTILVQQQPHRFVISCTFADVFMGAIPLIWNLKKSLLVNISILAVAAVSLFGFNILRLEIGQFLYSRGAPWMLTDNIIGGVAYFAVWLAIVHWFSPNWGSTSGKGLREAETAEIA